MLKGKTKNVFKKINNMDKKTAYTWGAIVIVVIVAVMTMATFMGTADDGNFDGLEARGYDLASMPFVSDEAEQFLLASKYPDMKDNGMTVLYSSQEKEERQEADAVNAEEAEADFFDSGIGSTVGAAGATVYGGTSGGNRSSGGRTEVGKLGSANMGKGSGSGVTANYNPGGDFRNFKDQNKGSERAFITPVPGQANSQRALARFQQGSRAAAGQRDSTAARKALIGGDVKGGAMSGDGVALGDAKGLNYEQGNSADVSGLDQALSDANSEAAKKNEEEKEDEKNFWQQLGESIVNGVVDIGLELGKTYIQGKINQAAVTKQYNQGLEEGLDRIAGTSYPGKVSTSNPEGTDLSRKAWVNSALGSLENSDLRKEIFSYASSKSGGSTGGGYFQMGNSASTTSTRSWTEYNACVDNGGKKCDQYKPNS